jgi:hypothetical protein
VSGRDPEAGPVAVEPGQQYSTAQGRRVRVTALERTVATLVEVCTHGVLAEALGECCPSVEFFSRLTWRAGAWRMVSGYREVTNAG